MAAHRLVALRQQEDYLKDENQWWNKLISLTQDEFELMPLGFIKKYGSYLTNLNRYNKENHLQENRLIHDYYSQIKNMKKLQTDEEKALMLKEFQRAYDPDVVTMKGLVREEGDYMRRQPRLKQDELSYNFEQYGRYSEMLSKAAKKD